MTSACKNANSHSSEILRGCQDATLAHTRARAHHSPEQARETKVSDIDLTGKMLIAMPAMSDPRFSQSVVFMCAHSSDGAMGLIVNKTADDLRLLDLFKQLDIAPKSESPDLPVHFGGPVEHGRGFVLHDFGYHSSISTLDVNAEFAMTATLDVLEDLAAGEGPKRALVALGYSGWGPGQLEAELSQNAWLTVDADPSLVFRPDNSSKWEAALNRLGVSAVTLSSEAGRA